MTHPRTTPSPPAGDAPAKDMVRIPSGGYWLGASDFYPEERPVRRVEVDEFWMDVHPVTNAEFRRFVRATGHVTEAERAPEAADFPDADPALLVAGSLVFQQPASPVPLEDWRAWWAWMPGADWRHPRGPDSTLHGLDRHPVVHVAFADALAYARWAGKDLPTEAEWEAAARGGLDGATYAWGDEVSPRGRAMTNTWSGEFPWQDLKPKGWGTTPVGSFPPNGYGLSDVTGNVWEWTADLYTADRAEKREDSCCLPRADAPTGTGDAEPGSRTPSRVIKGGSYLCAPNYCLRYRPAARQAEAEDTSTGHLGFRCLLRR